MRPTGSEPRFKAAINHQPGKNCVRQGPQRRRECRCRLVELGLTIKFPCKLEHRHCSFGYGHQSGGTSPTRSRTLPLGWRRSASALYRGQKRMARLCEVSPILPHFSAQVVLGRCRHKVCASRQFHGQSSTFRQKMLTPTGFRLLPAGLIFHVSPSS